MGLYASSFAFIVDFTNKGDVVPAWVTAASLDSSPTDQLERASMRLSVQVSNKFALSDSFLASSDVVTITFFLLLMSDDTKNKLMEFQESLWDATDKNKFVWDKV